MGNWCSEGSVSARIPRTGCSVYQPRTLDWQRPFSTSKCEKQMNSRNHALQHTAAFSVRESREVGASFIEPPAEPTPTGKTLAAHRNKTPPRFPVQTIPAASTLSGPGLPPDHIFRCSSNLAG